MYTKLCLEAFIDGIDGTFIFFENVLCEHGDEHAGSTNAESLSGELLSLPEGNGKLCMYFYL
jgi:hypothetical protein